MTLGDFETSELDSLATACGNVPLRRLLESRLADIKEDDFTLRVVDVEGMLKREFNRGLAQGYSSVLVMKEAIEEEMGLREKEALAEAKKK